MSITTDTDQVTLSVYASGRVRELLVEFAELNERIDDGLAQGRPGVRELLDDRDALGARMVEVLRFDLEMASKPEHEARRATT